MHRAPIPLALVSVAALLLVAPGCFRSGFAPGPSARGQPIGPATALSWLEESPYGGDWITARWSRSASPTLSNQLVQLFADPACASPLGAEVDLDSPTAESYQHAAADGSTNHFQIISVDHSGARSTSACSDPMLVDRSPPVLTGLTLNDGEAETPTAFVRVSLSGHDFLSITELCLRHQDSDKPSVDDPCWLRVDGPELGLSPGATIDVSALNYMLDFIPMRYTVYGWLKDELGHISDLSAAGAGTPSIDSDSIDYYPGRPPTITDVLATSSDAPADVPGPADLSIAAGNDVYIKWAAVDDEPLPAGPISLLYTTDDESWAVIAEGLDNASSGGCLVDNPGTSADNSATGCYRWVAGAPVDSFFRIRVVATDAFGATTFATSVPLNLPQLRFIAGNTEPGLGADATSSLFFPRLFINEAHLRDLVVVEDGEVFVSDDRGILRIDPVTRLQTLFLADDDVSIGDGVPVERASVRDVFQLVLDYAGGLVFLDHDRIRRVDLATGIVSDLIGGGDSTAATLDDPRDLKIEPVSRARAGESIFTPLPSGDLLFLSEVGDYGPKAIRHFHAATGQITTRSLQGSGFEGNDSQDITVCRQRSVGVTFDVVTSAIEKIVLEVRKSEEDFPACQGSPYDAGGSGFASLDPVSGDSTGPHPPSPPLASSLHASLTTSRSGDLYAYTSYSSAAHRYDPASNSWVHLLGSGVTGICPDGTDALACNVSLQSLYVSARGRLFFLDNGMLRTLDDSNRVRTLMGQACSWGDGGAPLSARLGEVHDVKLTNQGELVFLDVGGTSLRQVRADGSGAIQKIAGNGTQAFWDTTQPAVDQPMQTWLSGRYETTFGLDPVSGDIFFPFGDCEYHRLDRSTGRWQPLIHGTTHAWYGATADGQAGAAVDFCCTYSSTLGFDGASLLIGKANYRSPRRPMLKLYAAADGTQSHLIGVDSDAMGFPADGAITNASVGDRVDIQAQRRAGEWLVVGRSERDRVRTIGATGIGTLARTSMAIHSFHYAAADDVLYYTDYDGQLWAFDLTQPPGSEESLIDLGIPSLHAASGSVIMYDTGPQRELIFPYVQNGLYGIVAYRLP